LRLIPALAALLWVAGCQPADEDDLVDAGAAPCSADSDADGDGLDDCTEEELGLDLNNEDSDGDGYTDLDEIDCLSDPLDGDEACYACGWNRNDPGDLVSTGSGIGDVMDNVKLNDQCGEMVDVWDLYGEYHIIYHTAAW
jgi:hypothetical protein